VAEIAGISTRITFYVICFCYISTLLQSLNVLPAETNTQPVMDTGAAFQQVSEQGEYFGDPWLGTAQMAWQAVQAVVKSFIGVIYIFGTIVRWGIDPAYALAAQALVIAIYGYDLVALWKQWEIL
jgi:hypothetical protein